MKKRRLNVGSRLAFLRDRDISGLTEAGRDNGWEGIADYLAKTLDNNEVTRDEMRDLSAVLRDAVIKTHGVLTKQMTQILASDGTNQDKNNAATVLANLTEMMSEMKATSSVVSATLYAMRSYGLDERPCERAYRPDVMEKDLKILGEIDKRIEKTIARLVVLKEYKKMYSPKEVKALPAETISLPANQAS